VLEFLASRPLITLVVILAVGLAVGRIRVLGISLGAAAVLFVSLGLSTVNPDIQIPAFIYQLGLAMFVYAIGLSAGADFFREFRSRGWKLTVFMVVLLVSMAGLAWVLIKALGIKATIGTGMFAGAPDLHARYGRGGGADH
jgi:Predicted permease